MRTQCVLSIGAVFCLSYPSCLLNFTEKSNKRARAENLCVPLAAQTELLNVCCTRIFCSRVVHRASTHVCFTTFCSVVHSGSQTEAEALEAALAPILDEAVLSQVLELLRLLRALRCRGGDVIAAWEALPLECLLMLMAARGRGAERPSERQPQWHSGALF